MNMKYDEFILTLLVSVIYDYVFLFNTLMIQDASLLR